MTEEQGVTTDPAVSEELGAGGITEPQTQTAEGGELDVLQRVERMEAEQAGLRRELFDTRRENQNLRNQAEFYRDLSQGQPQQESEEEVYVGDLTNNQFKDLVGKAVEERLKPREERDWQERVARQEQEFRESHKDYDRVYSEIIYPKLTSSKDFEKLVSSAENPAEMAYNWARSHPKFAEISQNDATRRALQTASEAARQTDLASVGGTAAAPPKSQPTQAEKYANMSDEEIERELEAVLTGKRRRA